MWIARLIKPESPAYQQLRGKIAKWDPFFQLKPILFFPVWIMIVAGISAAEGTKMSNLIWVSHIDWIGLLHVIGLTLFIPSAVYEKLNGKNKSFPISMKYLAIVGFVIIFLVSVTVSFHKRSLIPLISVGWALMVYYTWKSIFNIDNTKEKSSRIKWVIFHTIVGVSLFMFGWCYSNSQLFSGFIHSIPYVLGYSAVALLFSLQPSLGKIEGIQVLKFSLIGWVVFLGTLFVSLAVIWGYQLDDPIISTSAIISLPFFVVLLIKPRSDHFIRSKRYPILILSFFVGVRYPWFFLPLFLLFHFNRIYFYFRYNKIYPSLSGHQ